MMCTKTANWVISGYAFTDAYNFLHECRIDPHDATATVCGQGVSIWLAIQSLEQLSAVYGRDRATILQGNCETQLYYRPNLLQTSRYLEERLGLSSGYSRSETLRHGQEASEVRSERPILLLASQEIGLLSDEEVIVWHRNLRPLKLRRMNWQEHPVLVNWRRIEAPTVWPLPPLTEITLRVPPALPEAEIHLDDPDTLVEPGGWH